MEPILVKIKELVGKFDTNCPFKIAQHLGIQVIYEDLGKTLGYFSQFCRIKIIHINENTNEYQRRFICAHELAHALLHPNANTPFLKKNTLFSTDKIELEANLFAIRLLFSDHYFNEQISFEDAVDLYGIPKKFILDNLKGD
ncbi:MULTISPECIES: ImmA/IrrE family metallo-endopeptidase [unclassified Bacillus (in: firmicutes)]|uniref:ImmA/IrrE family metallo-endopeptidase n=1 Tax=unclassified Bacillus (in: firmicutes) TaxID=185979 RepID=UPI001BE94B00|nr:MULTISPECIES: ImmA/IrrE family metallo-endopeptidase [unclassified Bacillus (in: firmicutes)]MBT2615293.1 ImmA/IrrE family metallo-endopeptidase [Bacillus sp. ISL-78]MBT2628093.1 ImmA/IrrE family metallo-endopeptidase [Bacillus sp. ISL-101]